MRLRVGWSEADDATLSEYGFAGGDLGQSALLDVAGQLRMSSRAGPRLIDLNSVGVRGGVVVDLWLCFNQVDF